MDTDTWISHNFHVLWNLLLWIFFQPFKKCKWTVGPTKTSCGIWPQEHLPTSALRLALNRLANMLGINDQGPGVTEVSQHWWKLTLHCSQWHSQELHRLARRGPPGRQSEEVLISNGCGELREQSLPFYPGSLYSCCHHQLSRQMKAQLVSRSFYKPVLPRLLLVKILICIRVPASLLIMALICSYVIFN